MRIRFTALLIVIMGALPWLRPAVLNAEPITLIGYTRHLNASALVWNSSGFVAISDDDRQINQGNTASAQAAFDGTTSTAASQLTSDLADDFHLLSGSARTSASVDGPRGLAQSVADVSFQFEVDQIHAFDFTGDFSKSGLLGSWQAHLIQSFDVPGGQTVRFMAISNTGAELQPRFRGSIDPGRYALFVRAAASGDTMFNDNPTATGRFDFTFEMTPVPEPASMLLVGSGVLGLAARARQRRRAKSADR